MDRTITLSARVVGRRSALIERRAVEIGPVIEPLTLRALVTAVVRSELRQFEDRVRASPGLADAEAISRGTDLGKVLGGTSAGDPREIPSRAEAIQTALQAVDDGLVATFVDDEEIVSLDSHVELSDGANVAFVRLVALSGSSW